MDCTKVIGLGALETIWASYRWGEAAMGELKEEPERFRRVMPRAVPRIRTTASTRRRTEPFWEWGVWERGTREEFIRQIRRNIPPASLGRRWGFIWALV